MGQLLLALATWLCRGSYAEEVRGGAATLLQKWPGPYLASENRVVTLTRATSLPSKEHMWQGVRLLLIQALPERLMA